MGSRLSRTLAMVLATAALGSAVVVGTASPSAADWQGTWGLNCTGSQVKRCAYMERDSDARRVRAVGNVLDVIGGDNYSVAAKHVQLQFLRDGTWTTFSTTVVGDFDGWSATWDMATSKSVAYACGTRYRALVYLQWQGPSPGAQWWASAGLPMC